MVAGTNYIPAEALALPCEGGISSCDLHSNGLPKLHVVSAI